MKQTLIPKLKEEEARYFVLKALSQKPGGKGDVLDIVDVVKRDRPLGAEDHDRNTMGRNREKYLGIIQNAIRHQSNTSPIHLGYITHNMDVKPQILEITPKGRRYLKQFSDVFDTLEDVKPWDFWDRVLLDQAFDKLKGQLVSWQIRNRNQFVDGILSKSHAEQWHRKAEANGVFEVLLAKVKQNAESSDDPQYRVEAADAWIKARDHFHIHREINLEL